MKLWRCSVWGFTSEMGSLINIAEPNKLGAPCQQRSGYNWERVFEQSHPQLCCTQLQKMKKNVGRNILRK